MSLLELYTEVVQPFHNVIFDIERGGFRVDEAVRKRLVAESRAKLKVLEKEIRHEAERYYESWMAELPNYFRPCSTHPEFDGRHKRTLCQGCAYAYQSVKAAEAAGRELLDKQRARWGAGIRPGGFAIRSDACWRRLLFDKAPHGFALKTSGLHKTEKLKLQKVDKDALTEIRALNPPSSPGYELVGMKIRFDSLEHTLTNYLWAKPEGIKSKGRVRNPVDERGFVHTCYSMMTGPGRLNSGDDAHEPGKVRTSDMGNMQNLSDHVREMYIADDEESALVQLDYRQMHVLLVAHMAHDEEMKQKVLTGVDTHSEHALMLAEIVGYKGITLENADDVPFPLDPNGRSFRHWGKLAYKLLYGMGEQKFSKKYGIAVEVCRRFIAGFFDLHPLFRRWQMDTEKEAQEKRLLDTAFGHEFRFWNFDRKGKLGDREEALAYRSLAIEAAIIKLAGRQMYDRIRNYHRASQTPLRLVTTTHDSWTLSCHKSMVADVVSMARGVMEQKWPQLDDLWCPVDVKVGRNWSAKAEGGLRKWTE